LAFNLNLAGSLFTFLLFPFINFILLFFIHAAAALGADGAESLAGAGTVSFTADEGSLTADSLAVAPDAGAESLTDSLAGSCMGSFIGGAAGEEGAGTVSRAEGPVVPAPGEPEVIGEVSEALATGAWWTTESLPETDRSVPFLDSTEEPPGTDAEPLRPKPVACGIE